MRSLRIQRGRRTWIPLGEIVTGERLQGLADVSLVPASAASYHRGVEQYAKDVLVFDDYARPDASKLRRLSDRRSLFVYTHDLPAFRDHIWPRLDGDGYVLISHNSDGEISDPDRAWLDATGPKLSRWFAQNALVSHPKLVPLPIGLANAMWEHGHLATMHDTLRRYASSAKTRLLAVNFHPGTHPARRHALESLRRAFPAAADGRRMSYRSYLQDLAVHRFCACPRGNGIDTHRLWECLYLDVVPVVERSSHTVYWAERGLPLLVIDDWQEVTPTYLRDHEHAFSLPFSGPQREPLRLSYYARAISEAAEHQSSPDHLTREPRAAGDLEPESSSNAVGSP